MTINAELVEKPVSWFEQNYSIGELDSLHETNGIAFPCRDGHIIMAVNEEEADEK